MRRIVFCLALALLSNPAVLRAADEPPLTISRAAGPISIDGNLDDPGWKTAMRVERFYETNPGDNVEPKVKTIAWSTYDDKFFYAALEMFDPKPADIRAAYGDHDALSGQADDFAGVILDTRNDGKTGIEFFVSARGTQFDAVLDDASGNEDPSPDFFWDSVARMTEHGWILELRIPFSSLRYKNVDPQTWGVMFYRNVPRERRYQIFSNRLPRGANCFVCSFNKVAGFTGLPAGGHVVAAPYVTLKENGAPRGDLGTPLTYKPARGDGGLDVKWTPNAYTAVDATLNPDFSQVESDVAAISTNQRFAIFFPEKRPFFLEGVELFNTPIQAVYTRTITSPRWGLRSTGKLGENAYTLLIAQDRGGGSIIIPGPLGSQFADQNFDSTVAIGRVRHDFGSQSFVSVLGTDTEQGGGAHNRVVGPDLQWKPNGSHTVTAQFLLSDTRTPDLTAVHEEWDARKLRSHAADVWWNYSDAKNDVLVEYKDYGDDFRADNGFVPQVGFRTHYAEVGRTFRPKGFLSRLRLFSMADYDAKQDGTMLYRMFSGGFGGDGKYRSNFRFRYAYETVRNDVEQEDHSIKTYFFQRHQFIYDLGFAVSRVISRVGLSGWVGQDVDYANNRLGRGANINGSMNLRPNPHLTVSLLSIVQWLTVPPKSQFSEIPRDSREHLFTSRVDRVRAQYTFNSRMFVRAIVQNQRTNRNRNAYDFDVNQHSGSLSSQFLFAYKLNWQSVLFFGFGDLRGVEAEEGRFEKSARQVFLKLSYAFQR